MVNGHTETGGQTGADLDSILRPQLLEVVKGHDLSHDEALLKVSVNLACSLRCLGALLDGPCSHLVLPATPHTRACQHRPATHCGALHTSPAVKKYSSCSALKPVVMILGRLLHAHMHVCEWHAGCCGQTQREPGGADLLAVLLLGFLVHCHNLRQCRHAVTTHTSAAQAAQHTLDSKTALSGMMVALGSRASIHSLILTSLQEVTEWDRVPRDHCTYDTTCSSCGHSPSRTG
jgi:hypothetical protein